MEVVILDPDTDAPARNALWASILRLAEAVRTRWGISAYLSDDRSEPIANDQPLPVITTWKLVEILSIFTILKDAERVITTQVFDLRRRIHPAIHYEWNGRASFLWTQERMGLSRSGISGIPDIVITTTNSKPSAGNISQVIEVKSGSRLDGRLIRGEFAKGYDLRVESYCIWSYHMPSAKLCDSAKALGLDLKGIGFDDKQRRVQVLDPDRLIDLFSRELSQTRRDANFERALRDAAQASEDKRVQQLDLGN